MTSQILISAPLQFGTADGKGVDVSELSGAFVRAIAPNGLVTFQRADSTTGAFTLSTSGSGTPGTGGASITAGTSDPVGGNAGDYYLQINSSNELLSVWWNDGSWNQYSITGTQGPVGPAGAAGVAGVAGQDGQQGATGAAGQDGQQGAMGAMGNPGAQGPEGPQGPAGMDGTGGGVGGAPLAAYQATMGDIADITGETSALSLDPTFANITQGLTAGEVINVGGFTVETAASRDMLVSPVAGRFLIAGHFSGTVDSGQWQLPVMGPDSFDA